MTEMEGKNLAAILLSLAIVIGAILSFGSTGLLNIKEISPETNLEIKSNESFVKGENAEIKIKAESSFMIKKIIYSSPTKTEEKTCNKTKCEIMFNEVFSKASAFYIEVEIELDNGNKLKEKKKIIVTETEKKCSDGTVFGECSLNKPDYCNNGKIEENCGLCGCEKGECINGSCGIKEEELEIIGMHPTKKFFKPEKEVNLVIESNGAKGTFEFAIEWKKNGIIEKSEVKTKTVSGNTGTDYTGFELMVTAPKKEGVYLIEVSYQGKTYSESGITIRNDSTAPAMPTGLTARKAEGKVLIGWNQNSEDDLMQYIVFRSNEDNQAYTTYIKAQTLNKTVTGTELDLWQTNYFYIVAVDYFGNKSAPSTVIEAT